MLLVWFVPNRTYTRFSLGDYLTIFHYFQIQAQRQTWKSSSEEEEENIDFDKVSMAKEDPFDDRSEFK